MTNKAKFSQGDSLTHAGPKVPKVAHGPSVTVLHCCQSSACHLAVVRGAPSGFHYHPSYTRLPGLLLSFHWHLQISLLLFLLAPRPTSTWKTRLLFRLTPLTQTNPIRHGWTMPGALGPHWHSSWGYKGTQASLPQQGTALAGSYRKFMMTVRRIVMCGFRIYPYLPHGRFFGLNPPLPLEFPV